MPSNKLIGAVAVGAAVYLMRNKETRAKTMDQLKSYIDPQTVEKIKGKLQDFNKSGSAKTNNNEQPL